MHNDSNHIQVEFHDKAKAIFFSLLTSFDSSLKEINRKKHEYQFQELKEKYTNTLKQQLEGCAMLLIEKYPHLKKSNEFNRSLQFFIRDYLHLFVQKMKSS